MIVRFLNFILVIHYSIKLVTIFTILHNKQLPIPIQNITTLAIISKYTIHHAPTKPNKT